MVAAAAQAAAKGWPGMAPQNAPMRAVSIQPLPVTRDMVAQPLWSRMVSLPSVSTSMGPETATTAPVCTASALAEATVRGRVFSVIWSASLTSTPLPAARRWARARISDALPRMTANCTASSSRADSARRRLVLPAPTGSKTTGLPARLAACPPKIMDSTLSMAPRLHSRALAAAAVSCTSRMSEAMVGEPPTARRMLAQSLTVTKLVMQSTSGARRCTCSRAEPKFMEKSLLVL